MSVQRYDTADGTRWRVRWREASGRMRSRSFISRRDAEGFDSDLKSRKFRGEVLPRTSRQTLAGAWEDWKRLVAPNKALSTRRNYEALWDAHIKRADFDQHRLAELAADPQLIDELIASMQQRGVGSPSQRKTLVVLSAVLTQCVRWKKIAENPVLRMVKPPAASDRIARPFPPIVVERIRQEVGARATKDPARRRGTGDAVLVALLAYAGLRPQEALALRWRDVGRRVLDIHKAVSFGEEKTTKTGKVRGVPLVKPLRDDLQAWRRGGGHDADHALVFPARDGGLWSHSAWNNWRNRVWKPVVRDLAKEDDERRRRLAAEDDDRRPSEASDDNDKEPNPLAVARPYDCRGSFVSLQLRAGASPLEVAQWAGHSPQIMWRHYARVIEELVGEPRLPAARQIELAREALNTTPADEVRELMAEGMKPPAQASPAARRLLFGPPRAPRGRQREEPSRGKKD